LVLLLAQCRWGYEYCGFAGENQFFSSKKRLDNRPHSATLPPTMKNESLNGILTFLLGVLVVLGVYFALRVGFVTHDLRQLQNQAVNDNNQILQFRALIAEVQAYNQKYPSTELTKILQPLQPATSLKP
jgi:hypothetical protein